MLATLSNGVAEYKSEANSLLIFSVFKGVVSLLVAAMVSNVLNRWRTLSSLDVVSFEVPIIVL